VTLPPYINNFYETVSAEQCDWAYGNCTREVEAVVSLPAHDDGVPLDATAERRPLCAYHLGVALASYSGRHDAVTVFLLTDDDRCAILEERGSRESESASDPGPHPSDLPHYYRPEL